MLEKNSAGKNLFSHKQIASGWVIAPRPEPRGRARYDARRASAAAQGIAAESPEPLRRRWRGEDLERIARSGAERRMRPD